MKIQIAPSILSADFGRLNEEIRSIEKNADLIHVDIMDGHFVPNLTIGPPVVAYMKTKKPIECHLMIEKPERYVEDFVKAGANIILIHQETCPHLHRSIQQIKHLGALAGVALNPATSLMTIEDILDDVDKVLLMTVNPGFGGQKFIESVLSKIMELRAIMPRLDIEVDGGVTNETAPRIIEAGANVLVSGTYIFGAKDRSKAIASLRGKGI
jgi:ribulose-phosphate 3-epimerase